MIVVVAEKPSVGRDIARVLGCRERGDGCLKNSEYLVTWAMGHLVSLCEPDELDEKYKRWRMDDLPILPEEIPLKVLPKTKKQYQLVKKYINASETASLICATDAGREGELIFRLIYEEAKCKKPVQRLWISSMTDAAIRDGFAALKDSCEYDGLYRSAKCRSLADWLVGMNASRAFTLRYNTLLSVGRVQTPTLAILVKRRMEIENFRPEEYYTLTAQFGDYSGMWFSPDVKEEKNAVRIPDREKADAIALKVKGKEAAVDSVAHEEKRELPPQLYDLTSLQRDANQRLGFTADKTLRLTQELYEKWKAVTYPRTDSRYLPLDMIPRTKQTLEKLPPVYADFVKKIPWQKDGKLPFSKRIFDNAKVSDHHAIIPTPQTARLDQMSEDLKKVFDLIARRTVAVFYPPFVYDAAKVITVCEGENFRSTGRTVRELGWKSVYAGSDETPKKKKPKEDEAPLPDLKEGDKRTVLKAAVKKETTKPPPPHTDASLLSAMENAGRELEDEALREQMKGSGLGTPATRAQIIERLVQVGYALRRGRAIEATEKGVQLIAVAPKEASSPETTGKWELALSEIAENRRDTERFMEGIRRLSAFLVDYAKTTTTEVNFPQEQRGGKKGRKSASAAVRDLACPLCGKGIMETQRAFGCSDWKNGCRFTLWKDCLTRGGGPALNEKIVRLILEKGEVPGSTGVIRMKDGMISFTPTGKDAPSVSLPITYEKSR
ncbi:MAG: DNA topoisomerase 3 [Clostridia bacterium]|nr:DNA topoisomerase 3 [Clostridia bacterium]